MTKILIRPLVIQPLQVLSERVDESFRLIIHRRCSDRELSYEELYRNVYNMCSSQNRYEELLRLLTKYEEDINNLPVNIRIEILKLLKDICLYPLRNDTTGNTLIWFQKMFQLI